MITYELVKRKLKEGMTIKNYKELCKILEIKISSGNSKIKQLQELSIFCRYTKEGNSFIIHEIYKQPVITLSDLIKTKNNKYIKLLSNIIVEYLYNNPKELQTIPLLKLFKVLGVTNTEYTHGNIYRKELSQLFDIQLASIYYFYSNTRTEYKKIIERCLNNLQSRRVLNWNRCVMIVDKENKMTYKADEETQKEVINMEKQALQYLNINNMYELMRDKSKLKEFNKILKAEMGFEYYYAYDLIIGDIALKIEYENVQSEKLKLNKLILDRTDKIFSKDVFLNFKQDYDILMNLLIDTENNIELKELLKNKHTENMSNYIVETLEANAEHKHKLKTIENTYLDNYDINN